jgi:hypothetical protein
VGGMNDGPDDAMDEVFGQRRHRPNHPDFWRISEVILGMDADFDPMNPPEGDRDALWRAKVLAVVDVDSVMYMAAHRVMRGFGSPADVAEARRQATIVALYMDAFIAGVKFQQAGGHQEQG